MPYKIVKVDDTFCVAKQDNGIPIKGGCHKSRKDAVEHLQALYSSESMAAVAESFNEDGIVELAIAEAGAETTATSPWEGEIAFENQSTGDNRSFATDSITWNELPVPLLFQKTSQDGHSGSWVIGRVDEIEKSNGVVFARGVLLDTPEANEYKNLLEANCAGGVSIDGDSAAYSVEELENKQHKITFNSIRIRALTAVAIPAFSNAKIHLVEEAPAETEFCDGQALPMGDFKRRKKKNMVNWSYGDDAGLTAGALVNPPSRWFQSPNLPGPTPLTVTADGQVYGHIALWGTCHIGMPKCTAPPKGGTYNYFLTGALTTAEGEDVSVGHLTFNTGHAGIYDSPVNAAAHYDHTGTVAADVVAGEDKHGIWVAGAMRPHLSEEQVRVFKAAPISGDWRKINSRMELVAALSVNTPGFPVPRTRAKVLVASGQDVAFISLASQEDFELFGRQAYKADLIDRVNEKFSNLDIAIIACAGHEEFQLHIKVDDVTDTPSAELLGAYKLLVDAAEQAFYGSDVSLKVDIDVDANNTEPADSLKRELEVDSHGLSQTPPAGIQAAFNVFVAAATARYGDSFDLEVDIDVKEFEAEQAIPDAPIPAPAYNYSEEDIQIFSVFARGNPDALRKYYEDGADGRINWGSEGDFTRCMQIAGKYIDDAGGFCQERHMAVYGESNAAHDKKADATKAQASAEVEEFADKKKKIAEKVNKAFPGAATPFGKKEELAASVTKTEDGKKFPASDYAYVEDPSSPSTWKLRLTSTPGGDPDPRIVGAAVAALGKGFRGNKVELPADAKPKVVAKVRAAWLKANSDKTEKDMPSVIKMSAITEEFYNHSHGKGGLFAPSGFGSDHADSVKNEVGGLGHKTKVGYGQDVHTGDVSVMHGGGIGGSSEAGNAEAVKTAKHLTDKGYKATVGEGLRKHIVSVEAPGAKTQRFEGGKVAPPTKLPYIKKAGEKGPQKLSLDESGFETFLNDFSDDEILTFSDEEVIQEFHNQCHDPKDGTFCEGPDGPGRIRDNTKKSEEIVGKKAPQYMKDMLSRKRGAAVKKGADLLPKGAPQHMKDLMKRKMEESVKKG